MLSHAPSRLHHSRTPSNDCRPIMPINITIVSEKAYSTSAGAHTKARHAPVAGSAAHRWRSSMMPKRSAWRTGTAAKGAKNAVTRLFQSRRRIEQKESSHVEMNTTDSGNGQYSHAVWKNAPKVSGVSSPT